MSSIAEGVLEAYARAEKILTPDMPDDLPVSLLCRFRLRDLRELKQTHSEPDKEQSRG